MAHHYCERTFTDSVKHVQQRYGSRASMARRSQKGEAEACLGDRERAFIEARDSFYMASVGETGWPYVQHRGGRPGFVKVLGGRTLGFPDFRGNRQYLSVGNLEHDDRVALILMDYPNRRRLKLLGRARMVEPSMASQAQWDQIVGAHAPDLVERLLLIEVEAFDWNCAQHITPRFTERELEPQRDALKQRIAVLETLLHRAGIRLPDDSDVVPSANKEQKQ